jgi:hypothetical protein
MQQDVHMSGILQTYLVERGEPEVGGAMELIGGQRLKRVPVRK